LFEIIYRLAARLVTHPAGLVGRWLAGTWNRHNVALNDLALQRLELQGGERVLEVGFGGAYLFGRMAQRLFQASPRGGVGFLAGVDAAEVMVSAARQRFAALIRAGHVDVRCATAEKLPYPAAHFSKAVSVNSLYWQDVRAGLAELQRALKPGGRLVLVFTVREALRQRRFTHYGMTLYDGDEVAAMLKSTGFSGVEVSRHADKYRAYWCVTGKSL
jgi:arsenite methyltransferase